MLLVRHLLSPEPGIPPSSRCAAARPERRPQRDCLGLASCQRLISATEASSWMIPPLRGLFYLVFHCAGLRHSSHAKRSVSQNERQRHPQTLYGCACRRVLEVSRCGGSPQELSRSHHEDIQHAHGMLEDTHRFRLRSLSSTCPPEGNE